MFIYGYDYSREILYCADFIGLNGYNHFEVGFDDFRNSYQDASVSTEPSRVINGIVLLKYNAKEHGINIKYIKQLIDDYIHGNKSR